MFYDKNQYIKILFCRRCFMKQMSFRHVQLRGFMKMSEKETILFSTQKIAFGFFILFILNHKFYA